MWRFAARRTGVGLVLLWVVVSLIFGALHAVPGDPARLLLSGAGGAEPTAEAVARVRAQLGLDQPFLTQYGNYLLGLVQGDLGESFRGGGTVLGYIGTRLPNTLELVAAAAVIAAVVGLPLGAIAARRGGLIDSAVMGMTTLGIAVPVYVAGILLVLVFSLTLGWFPAGGFRDLTTDPVGHLHRLVLPAVAVSMSFTAVVARMTRSAILDTMGQDWVRTARSMGLPRGQVFRRHVIRNSLNPVVTVYGLEVGTLIGSTVLVERVFNWPGLGSLLIDSVLQRDYPVVQGIVITVAVLFILINILVDISYAWLDPRVRW